MKKLSLILIVIAFFSTNIISQNNAIDKLFSTYADSDDFTSVFINAKMFNSFTGSENADEVDNVLSSIKGLHILTTSKNTMKFFDTAKSKLFDNSYEELMRVKDGNSKVLFFVKDSNGNVAKELILLVGEENESVLMSFTGNIDLDNISKLGKVMNIKGADKLDKLDK